MTYHVFVNAEKFPQFSEKFPLVGRWGTLAVIEVREDQVAELYAMVYALTGLEDGCTLIDENHRGYRPRADGSAVLMDKNTKWPYAAKEWEKDYQSSMKGLNKEISARDALLRKYGADAREEDGSILSYKPGRYVSKTHNLWFPYRVKYAKKPGNRFWCTSTAAAKWGQTISVRCGITWKAPIPNGFDGEKGRRCTKAR